MSDSPLIQRQYIPRVQTVSNGFQQLNTNTQIQLLKGFQHQLIQVAVDPLLSFRKVWAWFWSNTNIGWSANVDIVAQLNGAEVYRQKIEDIHIPISAGKWSSGIEPMSSTHGAQQDEHITYINNAVSTQAFVITPFKLNITADTFFMDLVLLPTITTPYDAGLIVRSEAGV